MLITSENERLLRLLREREVELDQLKLRHIGISELESRV